MFSLRGRIQLNLGCDIFIIIAVVNIPKGKVWRDKSSKIWTMGDMSVLIRSVEMQ